ncbi:hypothetical protein [Bacillus bombysepticus]|uniref:hypothetical protein n=1 Tax=Bacillus bombysepticus TaxID=658666 RepID=UPI00301B1D49
MNIFPSLSNTITKLMAKNYNREIEIFINSDEKMQGLNKKERICVLQEYVESLVNQELTSLSGGLISDYIGEKLSEINCDELLELYEEKPSE